MRLWATAEIASDGLTPIEHTLTPEPGARLAGRIIFDGGSQRPKPPQVWLVPSPALHLSGGLWGSYALADTGFSIHGIMPGRYIVHAADSKQAESRRWSLAAATLNGQDVLDLPLDLTANMDLTGLVLTLTDRISELSGTLRNTANQPVSSGTVVVFAADSRYWRFGSRRVRFTGLDERGRYRIGDLPAGDYRVAVVAGEHLAGLEANLSRLLPFSLPVTLVVGDRKVVDLVAGSGPDSR
jgi:hypothetical protein